MPVTLAHEVHKKKDPRSEFEKQLEKADGVFPLVLACPYGCGREDQPALDDFGYCEHLVGFTNAVLPDGPVKAAPAGAEVEVIAAERDALKRRCVKPGVREPLKTGDHLVRVNGTTRRVYRPEAEAKPEVKEVTAGTDALKTTKAAGKELPAPLG